MKESIRRETEMIMSKLERDRRCRMDRSYAGSWGVDMTEMIEVSSEVN